MSGCLSSTMTSQYRKFQMKITLLNKEFLQAIKCTPPEEWFYAAIIYQATTAVWAPPIDKIKTKAYNPNRLILLFSNHQSRSELVENE